MRYARSRSGTSRAFPTALGHKFPNGNLERRVPAARKYQAEGGPSLADCFALVRRATPVPAREVIKLLDDVALNFLVGNNDAHGKNFSLLYLPESEQPVLAPAYDVMSTFAYRASHNLTRKMAMSIGGEYRPEYVRARHLDRLFEEAGLGVAAARRRLRERETRPARHAMRTSS
jgi:serine/threonine-protein kinase HipA